MNGAIVTWIDPNSPAAHGHLQSGDIIVSALGAEVPDSRAVMRTVATAAEGAQIPLLVRRHSEMIDVTLQSVPWPAMLELRNEVLASPENIASAELLGLGLNLASVTQEDLEHHHLGDVPGVLIDAVAPGSTANNMNLQKGDVILQVGDQPATSPTMYRRNSPAPRRRQATWLPCSSGARRGRGGQRSGSVPSIRTNWWLECRSLTRPAWPIAQQAGSTEPVWWRGGPGPGESWRCRQLTTRGGAGRWRPHWHGTWRRAGTQRWSIVVSFEF